jgi:protein phosphatase
MAIKLFGIGPKSMMQDFGICDFSINKEYTWFIICDGIGGMPYGEVAANITVNTLNNFYKEKLISESQLSEDLFFQKSIDAVKQEFITQITKNHNYEKMGCTLCAVIINKMNAYICWSGDSKLYQFRDNKCCWDTISHSWAFDLYRNCVLTLDEARLSETNYLTGSINAYTKTIRFNTKKLKLQKADRLLICTDGIWSIFEHNDLIKSFTNCKLEVLESTLPKYFKEYANDNYFGFIVDI